MAEVLAEVAGLPEVEVHMVAGHSEHLAHSGRPHSNKVCSNSRQVHTLTQAICLLMHRAITFKVC